MTEYLDKKTIIRNIKKYNPIDTVYGLSKQETFDALVISPGWKPDNCICDEDIELTCTATKVYTSGYFLKHARYPNMKIAWIQCAAGRSNLIDDLLLCFELRFRSLFFAGSAGGLTEEYEVGDICTPTEAINPNFGPEWYLQKKLFCNMPLPKIKQEEKSIEAVEKTIKKLYPDIALKKAPVFCTDTISLEYSHLGEIKKTGAELIEMETATFLRVAPLYNVPHFIILAVSDNSATGKPLLCDERGDTYKQIRGAVIPNLIFEMSALYSKKY